MRNATLNLILLVTMILGAKAAFADLPLPPPPPTSAIPTQPGFAQR